MNAHTRHRHLRRKFNKHFALALFLTLMFAGIEALAGWWSGSLALLGDAGHMLTDGVALGLAMLAAWVATHPPSLRHSYGLCLRAR